MSDDDRLAALFRDAASDAGAPPPAFDHHDVLTASHRIGRRRTAMARGALGVLIVAGIGAAVVLPGQFGRNTATTASAPVGEATATARSGGAAAGSAPAEQGYGSAQQPGGAPDDQQADKAAPSVPPPVAPRAAPPPPAVQETGPTVPAPAPGARSDRTAATPAPLAAAQATQSPFAGTPLGPGRTDCADRQDPAVRAYLEQALPEVKGAPAAATTMECRSGGERGVSVEVTVDGATGVLSVQYLPPGAAGAAAPSDAEAATASGGTVIVSSRPAKAGGAVPFAGRLDATAAFLAPRL